MQNKWFTSFSLINILYLHCDGRRLCEAKRNIDVETVQSILQGDNSRNEFDWNTHVNRAIQYLLLTENVTKPILRLLRFVQQRLFTTMKNYESRFISYFRSRFRYSSALPVTDSSF